MADFLHGEGGMAEAIRAFRWEQTALGPRADWPDLLKTTVSTMLASGFPQCLVWGPGLVTIPNDAFLPILGEKADALGRSFADVWAEAWSAIAGFADAAFRGEATFIEDFPLVVDRGRGAEQAWFTFCYSPVRNADGAVCGMLDTVTETTAKVRTHAQSRLLANELAHRMKNLLAVFRSIAHQTYRALPPEEAHDALDRRLAALAAAHDVLTQSDWAGAPLRDVVEGALLPHVDRPGRISLTGPNVLLGGRQALSLGLAVHELATNAIKYGALSREDGRIAIDWEADLVADDAPFVWRWHESGGPPVGLPERRGFGSRLIERVLPADLGGTVSVDYAPRGLRLTLVSRTGRLTDADD